MMLSSLSPERVGAMLAAIDRALAPRPEAQRAFSSIAATQRLCPGLQADLFAGKDQAVDLARRFGMATLDDAPKNAFSWDGAAVRTQTETAVLLHEIAHWLIAPPERRCLPDFGLGAGPETGRVAEADAARCVDDATKETEENVASLLGILWEAELGGPALIAFCEQNWLELHDRPGTALHFVSVYDALRTRDVITENGRPKPVLSNPMAA